MIRLTASPLRRARTMAKRPASPRTLPDLIKPATKSMKKNCSSSPNHVPPPAPIQNTARIFRIPAGVPGR
jgi:hypothetical protein